ncbi:MULTISPECIES: acyl-ACP--UDP-N-acetylglucosamine O-acyltransferase [Afifella]|uniref:acyl-ACP--UDP-N-acetylglucosamine O-acyltransferase n=1 Tax=Afifella TaxID=643217 RepID=UPI000FE36567|nr:MULTISPECIES: acyl-ACP--UDP-N-acetylglucosamine O-acyltransferase [Afifella]MCT8266005.1 acyl-ACP--UDP-N-acetylglucosamine O-acyltransferase [Afifella sp. JA880]
MASIHPSAIVADGAKLAEDVEVGPFCVVGAGVELRSGVALRSHVVVDGATTIGECTTIFPFASVGMPPQDKKFQGEESRLEIGAHCVIREHVTINPGTEGGGLVTRIGDRCLLLVGAHVAHDCIIGNDVILVNNVLLGGHISIADFAIIGGGAALHQFVRVGEHAFVGGMSAVENDVIPFGSAIGNRANLGGLNIVGLKRRGYEREAIHSLRRAYRLLFAQEGTLHERLRDVAQEFADDANVQKIVSFIEEGGSRAICTPRGGREV